MSTDKIYFRYDDGTIIAENAKSPPEHFEWDKRVEKWRALALHYPNAVNRLRESGVSYSTNVPRYKTIRPKLRLDFDLHPYQKEGLKAWIDAGCLGTVVLPTGAGKTYLALKAIQHVKRSTLVIVPTIDLLNQWYDLLTNAFDLEIGILGGGYHELEEIRGSTRFCMKSSQRTRLRKVSRNDDGGNWGKGIDYRVLMRVLRKSTRHEHTKRKT